ncbi:DUF5011 domain-containing protein [Parvicella tangerina]|uniref:Pesticidal crystal protein Cry22Aa Ig-like domain-containing protein n=1 Tax=Parvicella tangerina TaxID=2829795 RepID=A0A916JMH1_9FLAO|nr:DUF5011 domain-containing protein [Parvicella tangerina]CAG5080768.1 hypothetical protein CRYO30217_01439 [Parvicella tangerina]
MKTTKLAIATILMISVASTSCKKGCMDGDAENYSSEAKKDDGSCVYAPTITLNGQSTITLSVGDTYTELGATAENADGSTAEVTVDNSDVNTSQVGTYTVTYSAENEHGEALVTRTVIVEINQSSYLVNWAVDCPDCGTTTFPLADPTVTAGATESDLLLDGFFTLVGGTAEATISGTSITFPQQTISITGGQIDFSGTGTMNSSGTAFTVDFTYDNTVPLVGGSGTATATYTKQ